MKTRLFLPLAAIALMASCSEAPSPTSPGLADGVQPVTTAPTSAQSAEASAGPTFTPFDVAPAVQNRDEVRAALAAEYPPVLREAGIAGNVLVWVYIDEGGTVSDVRLNRSSGHDALDQAGLRVAQVMQFSPAMNRDKAVAVWVAIPISFMKG